MNRVPSLEYVTVSRDAYDFLKHMLFGAWNSIYVAASERAYQIPVFNMGRIAVNQVTASA